MLQNFYFEGVTSTGKQ